MRCGAIAVVLSAWLLTGCGDEASEPGPSGDDAGDTVCEAAVPAPPTGPTAPDPVGEEDAPTGTVAGRLVHPDGEPVEGLRLLACTASICYWDDTDADGRFEVADLTLEGLKMQVGDPSGGHLDLIFYHLLDTEAVSELTEDVIVPMRDGEEPTPWSDEGGTVTLADGALELSVDPGALAYPFGTKEESVRAMRIEGADLPPYDWAPWADVAEGTFAFVVNPVGIEVEPGATVRVHGVTDAPCTVYRVWSVASKKGSVSYAGTATVLEDDTGLTLVTDADATIDALTTLIFSPVAD